MADDERLSRTTDVARVAAVGIYSLCVCALVLYIWSEGHSQGAAPAWLLYWCLISAGLAAMPKFPLAGVCGYVLLAYGMSSHARELDIMLEMRVLDAAAILILAGWMLSGPRRMSTSGRSKRILICGGLLFVWISISLVAAMMRGIPYGTFLRHDPSGFMQAAVVFVVTFDAVRTRRDSTILAILVSATIIGRAAVQGVAGIYLESYVATLLVIGAPIALLGIFSARHHLLKAVFVVAAISMIGLLALTQNRAAAVAAVCTVAVAMWQLRRTTLGKWLAAIVIIASVAMILIQSNYIDRFGALLGAVPDSPLASLAKSTAQQRLQLWTAGLEMATHQPLVGVGPGNYPGTLGIYMLGNMRTSAHSNYVQMLAETGIPGLVMYLAFFLGIVFTMDGLRRKGSIQWQRQSSQMLEWALIAYLIGGVFNSRHDFVLAYVIAGWALALREVIASSIADTKTVSPQPSMPL